ncbi:MAG: hypothetical protein IJ038_02265 [Clostridia bacterium]|nr:hypothetical protein [Clostridia bacterium]
MITKPVLNTSEENLVSPKAFGAVGDGIADDLAAIEKAVKYACENRKIVVLDENEYYISDGIELDGVSVLSHNAKLLYHGERFGVPAIRIKSNVNILGTLRINAAQSARDDAAERAPVAIGDYISDGKSRDVYIEELILSGGNTDSNGICMTGDCDNITIDRIIIPDGSKICRGVCIHWGNGKDHHTVRGWAPELGRAGYEHNENGSPMTHCNNIHLGLVDCAGFKAVPGRADNDKAAVTICAASNITIDEIKMHDSCHALCVTGADLGFEYADEAVRRRGQDNIYVKKITGTAMRSAGVLALGYPWYIRDIRVNTRIKIDECCVEAAEGNRDTGLALLGITKAEIGNITLKNFPKQAVNITRGSENIKIGTLNIEECRAQAATVNMWSEGDAPAKSIEISKLNISGNTDGTLPALGLIAADGFKIGEINVSGGRFSSLLSLTPECKNIRIDKLNADEGTFAALISSEEDIPAENNVSIGV